MKQYDIYIFDFDGTICDTKGTMFKVFGDGFRAVGIEDVTEEECISYMHQSLNATAKQRGIKEEDFQTFLDEIIKSLDEKETIEQSKAFYDTIEVLENLKKRGKTLAVASGNTVKHIKDVIEWLKWPEYFSTYMGSDIYVHPKPNGEPILMCLELLHSKPGSHVVYIGDSLQDTAAAANAGVDGILIDRENAYPDFKGIRISSLKDIL